MLDFRKQARRVVGALFTLSLSALAGPETSGAWSPLRQWPISATHSMLLPTGKMLVFGEFDQGAGPPLLWDPVTDTLTHLPVPDYNIFCAGHSFLADGRLLITGGHQDSHVGFPHASIFNPFTLLWSRVPDMNDNRWYPTNTTLPNGDVLVTSGETTAAGVNNPLAQVFVARSGVWRDLSNAIFELPYYPRQFVRPDGRVFIASPRRATKILDTEGSGAWIDGPVSSCCTRTYGPALLKDQRVYLIGGGDPPTATVEVLNLASADPAWSYAAPMSVPRRQHNAVFLPDGRIFVAGGSSAEGFNNADGAVYPTEVYDPATDRWTTWASAADFHGYHSTAVLLPDGRVFLGGGRGKKSMEVFSPPYLFQGGTRPTVTSAPTEVAPGQTFFVGCSDPSRIRVVSLVAPGSVTHAYDQNGRFNRLLFSPVSGGLHVTAPTDNTLAPPGPYLLFLVDDRGVPSIGRSVTVTVQPPATTKVLTLSDTWKYNDQGVDLGPAWMQPAYDDSSWPAGPGQLGYGDADEATKLSKRSPVQPSYYFRKKFTLAQSVSAATIEVVHDDGVAVWVNGVLSFSFGMDNGLHYGAWASASVSNKISRFQIDLGRSPLVVGENTIAVLVKQVSASSSDVSFALQLETHAGPAPESIVLRSPNGGERLAVGSTAEITWSTSGTTRPTVDLALSLDAGATWSPIASGVPNTGRYHWVIPDTPSAQALVRVSSDLVPPVSDRSDGVFSISRRSRVTAIAFGSSWKYFDSGTDPGAGWAAASFDDSAWRAGPAQLGYGDGDEVTVLQKTTPAQTSVYFRRSVDFARPVLSAQMQVLFDDGVAVYVNGVLALSRNMDRGLEHERYASAAAENQTDSAAIDPSLFVAGRNVVAVMVKQVGKTSPDLSFDLELVADVDGGSAVPVVLDNPNGGELLLSGNAFDITWSGGGSSVDLDYSIDAGGTWSPIASGLANTGTYRWLVPMANTTAALVRVSSDGDTDQSNGLFTIQAHATDRSISFGDVWKYHDSGSDPGPSWNLLTYDDSGWPFGEGQLGYGDGDETTVLLKTPVAQTSVYFRKVIQVDGPVRDADLRVLFDDGVAVYINGQLVLSRNMDRGLEHSRYASASAENEEAAATVPGSVFTIGANVVAVMVKQVGKSSPDLSFDLQLTVGGP